MCRFYFGRVRKIIIILLPNEWTASSAMIFATYILRNYCLEINSIYRCCKDLVSDAKIDELRAISIICVVLKGTNRSKGTMWFLTGTTSDVMNIILVFLLWYGFMYVRKKVRTEFIPEGEYVHDRIYS